MHGQKINHKRICLRVILQWKTFKHKETAQ